MTADNSTATEHQKLVTIFENFPIVKILQILFLFGLAVLFVFFASNEFMPDLDMQSIAGLLVAVALMSIGITLILGFSLLLPATQFALNEAATKEVRSLYACEAFMGIFGVSALLFGSLMEKSRWDGVWWLVVLFSLLFLVLAIRYTLLLSKKENPKIARTEEQQIFASLLRLVIWAIWTLIPTYFCLSLYKGEQGVEVGILVVVMLLVALAIVVLLLNRELKKKWHVMLTAAIGATAMLLFATNQGTLIPQLVMMHFGLSSGQKQILLVLDAEGCYAVNSLMEAGICAFNKDTNQGLVKKVRIVSRVGAQFLVQLPVNASTEASAEKIENWRRMILKKESMIAWGYDHSTTDKKIKPSK